MLQYDAAVRCCSTLLQYAACAEGYAAVVRYVCATSKNGVMCMSRRTVACRPSSPPNTSLTHLYVYKYSVCCRSRACINGTPVSTYVDYEGGCVSL